MSFFLMFVNVHSHVGEHHFVFVHFPILHERRDTKQSKRNIFVFLCCSTSTRNGNSTHQTCDAFASKDTHAQTEYQVVMRCRDDFYLVTMKTQDDWENQSLKTTNDSMIVVYYSLSDRFLNAHCRCSTIDQLNNLEKFVEPPTVLAIDRAEAPSIPSRVRPK